MSKEIWQPKLTDILPQSVLSDEKLLATAKALDFELAKLSALSLEVLHLPRLDELPESTLDLLAWQWHCDFYEPEGMAIETKRELIRRTIKWHRIKGTKAAVLELARTMLKDAEIEEWFEYGGEPYRFKLTATGLSFDDDDGATFFRMIESVKNVRSWLENVLVDLTPEPEVLNVVQAVSVTDKVDNVLRMDELPPEQINILQTTADLSVQTILASTAEYEVLTDRGVAITAQVIDKFTVLADDVDDDYTPDFERYLWEHWRRYKKDPLIQHYDSNHNYDNEYDFSDPDVEEIYPTGQFLRLYFRIGSTSRVRTLTVRRLREDIEPSEIKAFGDYTVSNGILLSRRGERISGLEKAFYVTRSVEKLL